MQETRLRDTRASILAQLLTKKLPEPRLVFCLWRFKALVGIMAFLVTIITSDSTVVSLAKHPLARVPMISLMFLWLLTSLSFCCMSARNRGVFIFTFLTLWMTWCWRISGPSPSPNLGQSFWACSSYFKDPSWGTLDSKPWLYKRVGFLGDNVSPFS